MTVGVGPRFVGREAEVAALVGEFGDGSALVVVEGEPGIGKSRLVRHVLGEAAGRTVLWCTAPALSEPFPLGPVVDGIRRLSPDRVPDGLSPMAGALRPLFPEWARLLPPPLDPLETAGATRHRLMKAVGSRWLGLRSAALTWNGATTEKVEVVRDGKVVATVPNTGRYTDRIAGRVRPSYTYRLCDVGTRHCSTEAEVDFTGPGTPAVG
ncbi:AAA family ATPase [Streptomyces sp. NBC_00184]|uniref:AAA family ATPase n=1 Tax=Streptomyces sp. NBC_00184 TaxID=2975673 RepID=UPI002E29F53A|nr:AAA family ATPase [Streptomyces sp. NBC_00184]